MPIRRILTMACLANAVIVCFFIVPIKALGFPAIGASPAVWALLDPLVFWHGLHCIAGAITGSCSNNALDLSGVFLSIMTRVGICICATASGYWAFDWLRNHRNGR